MYRISAENVPHEGTWFKWPHRHTYGIGYRREIENIWVQMDLALHSRKGSHDRL